MHRKIVEMFKIMNDNRGVGLSACQVGWPVRIFIANTKNISGVFINPVIISKSNESVLMNEGCLSYPGKFLDIHRPKSVEISYYDTRGEQHQSTFHGLEARIVLHEMDHLEGITYESR